MLELHREEHNALECLRCLRVCLCSQLAATHIPGNQYDRSTDVPRNHTQIVQVRMPVSNRVPILTYVLDWQQHTVGHLGVYCQSSLSQSVLRVLFVELRGAMGPARVQTSRTNGQRLARSAQHSQREHCSQEFTLPDDDSGGVHSSCVANVDEPFRHDQRGQFQRQRKR